MALLRRRYQDLQRRDLRSAIVATTLANIFRNPRRGRAFDVSDFMVFPLPRRRQTIAEQIAIMKSVGGRRG